MMATVGKRLAAPAEARRGRWFVGGKTISRLPRNPILRVTASCRGGLQRRLESSNDRNLKTNLVAVAQ
ncbi:unnamed protein product [Linum trigynum]|uniref:Uncharacterized protein n=1 Tax=Linum trigynum TaxID=586398 RepID=A0AAV2ED79_9ROSI